MKGRVIVIDSPRDGASRAALIVDGRLEDLILDPAANWQPGPGDIFQAKITRPGPAGAQFARGLLGQEFDFYLRDAKGLKPGQEIVLQVSSFPEPGKAIPATTRLTLKMRYLIHTPYAPGVNVSRQIKDPAERERLLEAMSDYTDYGFIIRTSAIGRERAALVEEAELLKEWGAAIKHGDFGDARVIDCYKAGEIAQIEWSLPDPDVIYFTEGYSFNPELDALSEQFSGDPFDHFGVWDEIEKLKSPRADLPSGGWMAVEATRAMVTVDVNTGDGFGTGDAMTANIEAARELPRQLRLRGLGGQVIIDFAPLKKMHRKKIEETLKAAFRKDAINTTLAGWTPLGNFELTRKRERRPLADLLPG